MNDLEQRQKIDRSSDPRYFENLSDAAINSMWGDPGNHKLWETSTRELASYVSSSPDEGIRRDMDKAVGQILRIHVVSRCPRPHVLSKAT